jgi:hypothetical protein
MSDNISEKEMNNIFQNEEEEYCKYCDMKCINDCKKKILNRDCVHCGIHIDKSSNYDKHMNRKTPCIEISLIEQKKKELGLDIKNQKNIKPKERKKEEIEVTSNETSEEYISEYDNKNNIISTLVDKFEKNLSERMKKENELIKQLNEKEEEINKLKNNNKYYYDNRVKLILENELEQGDIEILKVKILEEKDINVLKNILSKMKRYNNSIKEYFEKVMKSYTNLWILRTKSEKEINIEKNKNIEFYNKIKNIFSEEDRYAIEELINENIDSEEKDKKLLYF